MLALVVVLVLVLVLVLVIELGESRSAGRIMLKIQRCRGAEEQRGSEQ